MKYSNLNEEKKLWKKGFRVVGIDEVGRGPLAGPVVACAVTISNFTRSSDRVPRRMTGQILKLRDSKKLSLKQREELYRVFVAHPSMRWGIGIVSEKIIDKINIYQATKLAMTHAVQNLEKSGKIDFLIIDGRMRLNLRIPQKAIVKGDEKVFSCAAASIIAKVTRDRIMMRYHKKYPQYGFNKHKGYGTKLHLEMLEKHGICKIHRRSFAPIQNLQ